MRHSAVAIVAFACSACGTTVSTLQPAEPMRPGHVQAQGAFSVNVPASRIIDAVDTVATLSDRYASDSNYKPSDQEQKDALRELVEAQTCVLARPYEGLDAPVVASAWGKQLRLESADASDLQSFIQSYRQGPQTPEPGAACTGGTAESL